MGASAEKHAFLRAQDSLQSRRKVSALRIPAAHHAPGGPAGQNVSKGRSMRQLLLTGQVRMDALIEALVQAETVQGQG